MKGKILLATIPLSLLLGCSLLPSSKNQSHALSTLESLQGKNALTIQRTLESKPQVPLLIQHTTPLSASRAKINANTPAKPYSKEEPAESFNATAWAWPAELQETITVTDNSSYGAGSTEATTSHKETVIPLGVKMILAAIGLLSISIGVLAILYAWRIVKKSNATIAAASHAADQFAAGLIRSIRQRASASTDPSELAKLNADIAALEADRGRLALKKAP